MPLFSRFYGLHPWDLERLTVREISEYRTKLQQFVAKGGDPWQVLAGS